MTMFGQRRQSRRRVARPGYERYLTVTDGDSAYDTSGEVAAIVQANTAVTTPSLIWRYTVPAQQALRWGFGSPNQQRNQGVMHAAFGDAGTGFEEGLLQLRISNARQTTVFIVAEFYTSSLHTVTATNASTARPTDINAKQPLPEQIRYPKVREDSFLELWFVTREATTTVDFADFSIPVTVY